MLKLTLICAFFITFGIHANPIQLHDEANNEIDTDDDFIDLSQLDGRAFGDPDEEVGRMLQEAVHDLNSTELNPEELGSYFEGDILMPKIEGRSALADGSKRWPNGVVPYTFSGHFPPSQKAVIDAAINEYHAKTCIRFKPRTSESDYIVFKGDNTGCWSSVGRTGGAQTINLQLNGCLSKKGTAIHEIAHAMGIFHEQNRADRDNHVQIRFENIQKGLEANFEKASPGSTSTFGVPYDYGSVMHYSANAFSTNGRPTIVALQPIINKEMGQRDGFSLYDIEKINALYGCNRPGAPITGGQINPNRGSSGPNRGTALANRLPPPSGPFPGGPFPSGPYPSGPYPSGPYAPFPSGPGGPPPFPSGPGGPPPFPVGPGFSGPGLPYPPPYPPPYGPSGPFPFDTKEHP